MVDENLIDYIEQEELHGESDSTIENRLLEAGWSEEQVEEGLQYVQEERKESDESKTSDGSDVERPLSVTVIAVLHAVFGVMAVGYGIYSFVGSSALANIPFLGQLAMVMNILTVLSGIVYAALAYGLWELIDTARKVSLFFLYVGLIGIVTIPVNAVMIYFLHHEKDAFH